MNPDAYLDGLVIAEVGRARRSRDGLEARPAIGSDLQAAVNASSVVAFAPTLSPQQKEDVLCSLQLAQRAAWKVSDPFEDAEAWYRKFIEVMENVGWVGMANAPDEQQSDNGEFETDRSALDIVAAIATGGQLLILMKAIDVMKGLADEEDAIRVFEMQATATASGNYQLGEAGLGPNGNVKMALGAFRFRATDGGGRVLFFRWGRKRMQFWAAAAEMILNDATYARVRKRVREMLGDEAEDYVARLLI